MRIKLRRAAQRQGQDAEAGPGTLRERQPNSGFTRSSVPGVHGPWPLSCISDVATRVGPHIRTDITHTAVCHQGMLTRTSPESQVYGLQAQALVDSRNAEVFTLRILEVSWDIAIE